MVRRFRCIKELYVSLADDPDIPIENAPCVHVPEGRVYEVTEPGLTLDVWLRSKFGWLDLPMETFRKCFEEVGK